MNTIPRNPVPSERMKKMDLRITEHQSPLSDSYKPLQYSYAKPRTARQALIVLSLLLDFELWENDTQVRSLGQMCFFYKYEGKWRIVQSFLEETTNFQEFEKKYKDVFGPHDFYGNFLPSRKRWKKTEQKKLTETGIDKHKVKQKVYRRGYDDKGTLRPFHKPILPGGESEEREDRRQRIKHPLLQIESSFEKIQEAEMPLISFVKEVKKHVLE